MMNTVPSPRQRPSLPLPPPLRGNEYDSFAYYSIVDRLPQIGRRVLETNDFPPAIAARLEELLAEIGTAKIRLLHDATAPDTEAWIEYVAPYLGYDWLEVPWFFAEFYFYRRVLEATGYFIAGPGNHVDPFAPQKRASLEAEWAQVQSLATHVAAERRRGWDATSLGKLLSISLWGNQGDLSMWPAGAEEQPERQSDQSEFLLVDERAAASAYLAARDGGVARLDMLLDNAGFELVSDLALVDYLLDSERVATVGLHVKYHPIFVSDTLIKDVRQTVDILAAAPEPPVAALGARLQRYLAAERIRFHQHRFWTSPLAGWEMPEAVRQTLAEATVVISKGDAHYRRLLGDRHWSFSTPFARIVSYFPAPLLALRTLKSDLAAGIAPSRLAALAATGEPWTISGKYGVIQFALQDRAAES